MIDNLGWICVRFMKHLRQNFRGHKAEISPGMYTKLVKKFSLAYGVDSGELLMALTKRGWLEPSAGDIYLINYNAIRR